MALILIRAQNVSKRLAASRINAMQRVHNIKPDSGGFDPAIHDIGGATLGARIMYGHDKCTQSAVRRRTIDSVNPL